MFNNNDPHLDHYQHLHYPSSSQQQSQHQGSWCSPAHIASPHFFQQHSSAFHPGSFTSPSSFGTTSLARMESTFCKNFVCCSIPLDDLHDLLEHFEQAHCHQSSTASGDSTSSSPQRPDVIVFEDEDEWSGTESASTNQSATRSGFDRSQSPPDHNWAATCSTNSRDSANHSRRKHSSNPWSHFEDGFGIPPSLLDGHHHPNSTSGDPNQLLMMIDADEDGSSSTTGSDRNLENRSSSSNPDPSKKRRFGSEQRDWESSRDKPFKCLVPGCEKAYKQPNGLKYHKAHGHCSQKTLSAEEESKTFVCHDVVCGKRYKNINGLRYHYQHTGPHGAIGLQLLSLGLHPSGSMLNLTNLNSNHEHRHPLLTNGNSSWTIGCQEEGSQDETMASDDLKDVLMDGQ